MRVYTVHLRHHGLDPDRDLAVVKEGFCWPAFLFTVLWSLAHRLWWVTAALFALQAALSGLLTLVRLDALSAAVVALGVAVVFGFLANDLRRWTLGRDGFVEAGTIVASGRDEAERRFLDSEPELARDMRC